jgi:hypothetical protein
MVLQLVAFPWLQRKLGTVPLLRLTLFIYLILFVSFPVLTWFAREVEGRPGAKAQVWAGLGVLLSLGGFGSIAMVCLHIYSFGSIYIALELIYIYIYRSAPQSWSTHTPQPEQHSAQ